MQAYTIEKIEPSPISSGARLDAMLREMEELFAARFGMSGPWHSRVMLTVTGGTQRAATRSVHRRAFEAVRSTRATTSAPSAQGYCLGWASPPSPMASTEVRITVVSLYACLLTGCRFPAGDQGGDTVLGRPALRLRYLRGAYHFLLPHRSQSARLEQRTHKLCLHLR